MRTRLGRRIRDERGLVFVWMAVILVVLLGMAGFGVDVGAWYARSYQLQRAADAAALAGAVWMPDNFNTGSQNAVQSARDALMKNGIDWTDTARYDISIAKDTGSPFRLKVSVKDKRVKSYFSKPFISQVTEQRRATGEYVLPVPLGSPTNYFGTGDLLTSSPENVTAAVNGFCTSKEDGDEILSRYDGTNGTSVYSTDHRCPTTGSAPQGPGPQGYSEDNDAYDSDGYAYYVELPASRSNTVIVDLYDAPFFNTGDADSPDQAYPLASGSSTISTTFRLRAPDGTPLDDSDNPTYACTGTGETNPRTFTTNQSAFTSGLAIPNVSGSKYRRWTRFCTIPTSAAGGRYILEVRNQASQANSFGINAYGVFLQNGSSSVATCDSRTLASCPRIYGRQHVSVYADAPATASFFLAEVDPAYAGKDMEIRLWDPGEGGQTIQIMDPANNAATFDWETVDGAYSGTNKTSLDVSGTGTQPGSYRWHNYKFNDRSVKLTVHLPSDYATRYGTQRWWRIRYTFSGSVTDRTTWSVSILGNPVHLVAD